MLKRLLPALLLAVLATSHAEDFNWNPNGDATLEQFLQYVKSETGKNFIYDPADLKDKKITILAPDFHKENLLAIFEAALEMQKPVSLGLALTGDGQTFKIVPADRLRMQPLPIYTQEDLASLPKNDRLITQVVTLKHVDPVQIVQVLQGLMHVPTGDVRPIPNSNVVVITEYASNMPRLVKIVEIMDRENAPPRVEMIPLKYATSGELAPRLNTLMNSLNTSKRSASGIPAAQGQAQALVTDDPRTNSVIVIGYEADLKMAKELIGRLDADLGADQNTIQFFQLQHRNAKELADVIKAMYSEVQDAARASAPGPGTLNRPGQPPQPMGPATAGNVDQAFGVLPRIVADEDTNSIIAIGPPRSFKELKATIDKLDTRRPQVFIEATIMEVGENSTRELGTQLASVEQPNDRSVFFGGTSFGLTTPDPTDPTKATVSAGQGLIAGVFKDSTSKIPFILRALQTNNDADVIATPSIMTNDNEKASVTISDQQPTTTTQTGTATTNTTFAQFVNADTTLDITPHISSETAPDGTRRPYLRLEITQKLEKFVGASTAAGVPPPKESRTTTTTVTVPDAATIVISGFTRKDQRVTVNKVPFLGDIPLLGFFFRHKTTVNVRTNLFVFITPHIITDLGQLENFDRELLPAEEREAALRKRFFGKDEPEEAPAPDAPPPAP